MGDYTSASDTDYAALPTAQVGSAHVHAGCALYNPRASNAIGLSCQPFRSCNNKLLVSRRLRVEAVVATALAGSVTSSAPKQRAAAADKQGKELLWYRTPSTLDPGVQVLGISFHVTIDEADQPAWFAPMQLVQPCRQTLWPDSHVRVLTPFPCMFTTLYLFGHH